jgi:hypothetical protein
MRFSLLRRRYRRPGLTTARFREEFETRPAERVEIVLQA